MLELLIVVGIVGLMGAMGGLAMLPWEPLFTWGGILIAVGHAFGVPAGIVFHVLLYRALARRATRRGQRVERGWYWRPIPLAQALPSVERGPVMAWAVAGGVGFVAIVLGIVLVGASMASAYLNGV